jgi:hypothetical protein
MKRNLPETEKVSVRRSSVIGGFHCILLRIWKYASHNCAVLYILGLLPQNLNINMNFVGIQLIGSFEKHLLNVKCFLCYHF